MRVCQYRYVKNSEFKLRRNLDSLCYGTSDDDYIYTPPAWIHDVNEDHLHKSEAFIENIQDGYCGPVISYYERYHANNSFFV